MESATLVAAVLTAAGGTGVSAPVATGFWTITAGQLVPLVAALVAVGGVVATLLVNAASTRRQNLTTLYGDALAAVAGYLEGPYRILRKDGQASTRFTITSGLSDVKTDIDHHQALLRLHADPVVADAYDYYVTIAKTEAGKQMSAAWDAPPVKSDKDVNLVTPLPRGDGDEARAVVVDTMQAHLRRRWYHAETRTRFSTAARNARAAIDAYEQDAADKARQRDRAAAVESGRKPARRALAFRLGCRLVSRGR